MFKGELERDLKGYLKGDLKGDFEVDLEVDLEGDFRGDFKQDLLSSSDQLRSRSGLVQVWFSIELKFIFFELDSEVGRLVLRKGVIRYYASPLQLFSLIASPHTMFVSKLPSNKNKGSPESFSLKILEYSYPQCHRHRPPAPGER